MLDGIFNYGVLACVLCHLRHQSALSIPGEYMAEILVTMIVDTIFMILSMLFDFEFKHF